MGYFRLKALVLVYILGTTALFAQNEEHVDTAIFNKIRKAELKDSHIPYIAHYLTDVSGPRLTGSPGFKRAGNWAVENMKKWGLVNASMEPWGEFGKNWELQDFNILMKVPYAQPLLAYPDPWSSSTNGLKQARVILLTEPQSIDSAYIVQHAEDLKGKIILVVDEALPTALDANRNFSPYATRLTDVELSELKDANIFTHEGVKQLVNYINSLIKVDRLLKKSGAVAVIDSRNRSTDGMVGVVSYEGYQLKTPESLPKVSMAFEDAQKIKRIIESGQPVEIALNIQGKTSTEDTKGYNVIAEIPGTDPKLKSQVVMLGAHLDSWSAATGATDNAAGCIVMMEAVRLLDSLNLKPKRTIRIALWSGEEQGVFGSYNYVKKHFIDDEKGIVKPEHARLSAYFNLDNGTGKIRGIYAQNNTAVKPIFEQWLAPFHDLGASTVTLKNTGSTDHISFDWAGIPGFQFIQDPIDYESRTHHSNMDNYDHLQIDDLKQAAIIVASFVYQTSVRPDLLPRKPFVKEVFPFAGL